jgi:hypothetical protein
MTAAVDKWRRSSIRLVCGKFVRLIDAVPRNTGLLPGLRHTTDGGGKRDSGLEL